MIKKNGVAVIDQAVAQFTKIVDGLSRGISLCETKHDENAKKIETLSTENTFLGQKVETARVFRGNLQSMMSKAPAVTEVPVEEETQEETTEE